MGEGWNQDSDPGLPTPAPLAPGGGGRGSPPAPVPAFRPREGEGVRFLDWYAPSWCFSTEEKKGPRAPLFSLPPLRPRPLLLQQRCRGRGGGDRPVLGALPTLALSSDTRSPWGRSAPSRCHVPVSPSLPSSPGTAPSPILSGFYLLQASRSP